MKNNEIAAFPIMPPAEHGRSVSGYPYPDVGMTLRDYFAAKAMQALISSSNGRDSWIAIRSYEISDAMLKARAMECEDD